MNTTISHLPYFHSYVALQALYLCTGICNALGQALLFTTVRTVQTLDTNARLLLMHWAASAVVCQFSHIFISAANLVLAFNQSGITGFTCAVASVPYSVAGQMIIWSAIVFGIERLYVIKKAVLLGDQHPVFRGVKYTILLLWVSILSQSLVTFVITSDDLQSEILPVCDSFVLESSKDMIVPIFIIYGIAESVLAAAMAYVKVASSQNLKVFDSTAAGSNLSTRVVYSRSLKLTTALLPYVSVFAFYNLAQVVFVFAGLGETTDVTYTLVYNLLSFYIPHSIFGSSMIVVCVLRHEDLRMAFRRLFWKKCASDEDSWRRINREEHTGDQGMKELEQGWNDAAAIHFKNNPSNRYNP